MCVQPCSFILETMNRRKFLTAAASAGTFAITGCQRALSDSPLSDNTATPSESSPQTDSPSRSARQFTASLTTWTPELAGEKIWVVGNHQRDLLTRVGISPSYQTTFIDRYLTDTDTLRDNPHPYPHEEIGPVTTETGGSYQLYASMATEFTISYEVPETTPQDARQFSAMRRPVQELIKQVLAESKVSQAGEITQLVPAGVAWQLDLENVDVDGTVYRFLSYPTTTPSFPPTDFFVSAWPAEINVTPQKLVIEAPLSDSAASQLLSGGLQVSATTSLSAALADRPYLLSPTSLWRVDS